jgi:4'-phosphopantetheinyl transferase
MPEISSKLSNHSHDVYVKLWKIEEKPEFFQIFPESWSMPPIDAKILTNKFMESIAARFCLWELMKSVGIENLELQQDQRNRPYLNHPEWQISISHSYPFAVACLSKKQFTGIDLEKNNRNVQKIAPRFLNPAELLEWNGDNLKLTLAWSAKESIYKAWQKPGLSFQKEIHLTLFNEDLCGKIEGNNSFTIQYELFDEFVITLVNH